MKELFIKSHARARARLGLFKGALLVLIVCLAMPSALAATKVFTGPGNFSEAAKWGGALPKANDTLRINGICTFDNAAANLTYATLEVGKNSAGTLVWPVGGVNTLRITGIVASSISGTIDMTNGGTLSIGSSNWITTRQTFIPGAGTIIWADTATGGNTLPATAGFTTFNNLTIATLTRTATLGAATTINGRLTLESGTLAASTFSLVVKGDWTRNGGTFTPNTATVIFNGAGAQKIGGYSATAFNNLAISNTSAIVSAVTNLTVAGTMTIGAGAIFSPVADKTINNAVAAGTLTGAGTLRVTRTAATADLVNQYKFTTYNISSLTVEYEGAGDQRVNSTLGAYKELILSGSGTKTLQGAVTNNGSFTISAGVTLADAGFVLTTKGNVAHTGTHSGTGKILLAGTLSQTLSGAGAYGNLEVSNSSGILLTGSPTVNGTLTLTTGRIATQTSQLNLGLSASVTRGTGWINGKLQKAFAVGNNQTFTFPIGDNSAYRPVALSDLDVTTSGTLAVNGSGTGLHHPQLNLSDINASKDVMEWWTLTANTLVVTNYNAEFTFLPSDIDGGGDPDSFHIRRWNGSSWSMVTRGLHTATSTQATGLTAFGDFVIGELLGNGVFITLPGETFVSGIGNTGTPSNQLAGVAFNILLTAVTAVTNVDLNYSGAKTISYSGPSNSPSGSAAVYTTDVTFLNGQASLLSTTLKKAEITRITGTDGAILTNNSPSSLLTVLPGPVSSSQSTLVASPTSLIADGAALSTNTVTLKDAFENPLSGKSVTLSSSRGATDQLSAASGSSSASGVVTFTVSSIVSGSPLFTATDTTDGNVVLTQTATVTFLPDVLDRFAITPSPLTGSTAGTPITDITLTAQDANNNTVASFQGTVAFGGTAGITGNSASFVNGVRTGVSITPLVAGTNLTVTVGNATGKSGSTTISSIEAATLNHYSVDFIRPVYVGVPFTVTVTARDAYDNVTTNGLVGKEATLTTTKGIHTFTPNPITVWMNGQGTASNTFNNESTNLTISASDGTYSGTSASFDVVSRDGAYRTRDSGDWEGATTWEAYAGSWVATNLPPTAACPSVLIKANHVVTVTTTPSADLERCHVDGSLVIDTQGTLTLAGLVEVHHKLQNNGTLNLLGSSTLLVQTPGVLKIDEQNNVTPSGTIDYTVEGIFVNAGAFNNVGTLNFAPQSIYRHAHTNAAVAIPLATTWGSESICEVTGLTGVDGAPAGLDQRFQHLVWNCTNQVLGIILGSGFTNLVNFTVVDTGTAKVKLGANLTISNATVATRGGLSCGTNIISGGSFTLQTQSRFGIGSPDGITTNSAAGNIQTTLRSYAAGARFCYDGTVAQVTGDGLPLPVAYLAITNSQGVAMTRDVNVAYLLELQSGSLTIGSHALTVRGELVTGSGFLTGGTSSTLSILDYNSPTRAMLPGITNGIQYLTIDRASGGTLGGLVRVWETILLQNGTLGGVTNLFLADGSLIIREEGSFLGPGAPNLDNIVNAEMRGANITAGVAFPPSIVNSVSNMTFANISGVVKLQYDLNLKGNLTIRYPSSRFDDNGTTLTVQGNVINNGTYISSGRLVLSGGSQQHLISGTGTFDRVEIADTQGVLLQNAITVLQELTLTSGTLANSTNLTLGSGATVWRAAGALDGAPTFSGPVDVNYVGASGVTAGYELPAATNLLHDLKLDYSSAATLTLNGSRSVNNDLTIGTNATLADAGYTLTVVGNVYNHGVASGAGKIALDNAYSQVLFGSGTYGNLELVQGEISLDGNPTVNGALTTISATLNVLEHTLTLNGFSIGGAATNLQTTLDSSLVFGGSATGVQIPSSVTQVKDLTINNPNGLALQSELRVEGRLSLLQGVLDTGLQSVQLNNPANDTTTIVRVGGWIKGALTKYFVEGAGQAFSFPVGGATAYRPAVFSQFDVTGRGNLKLCSVESLPADMAGSGLDTNRTVQAYWQGTASGRFEMVNGVCSFYFANEDIPAGADPRLFNMRVFSSAATSWLDVPLYDRGTNYTQGVGIYTVAIPADDRYEYGNFVVGESLASQILMTLPGQTYTNTFELGSGNAGTVNTQVAGTPFNLQLRAVDIFNAVDADYTGEKTISTSGPSIGLNGSEPNYVTAVTFANGVATALATTLRRAETTTLTATDGVLPGVASSPLTVTGGAANVLTFTTPTVTVTAGFPSGAITVQLQDGFGNPVISNQLVTVELSSTSGGSVLFTPEPLEILQGFSQATFSYWDDEVGTPWLRAQSGSLMDATQQVSVVAPTTLVWDGGGADNHVLTVGNWQASVLPREGDIFAFAGVTRLTVTNDLPAYTALSGVRFLSEAGEFVLAGAPITLVGEISNHATVQQTLQLEVKLDKLTTVDVSTNGILEVAAMVSGDYSLTKTNAGTLILTGTNTYSGGTIVQGGVLTVNNTEGSGTGSGSVTVEAGGTLGGKGSISGQTVIAAGGVLAPGFTDGTMTFQNNLVMQPSAEFRAVLNFSTNQVVVVAGTAVISGTTLSVTGVDPLANTYTLLRAGNLSGTFAGLPAGAWLSVAPGLLYRIHYSANEVILVRSQGPTFISFF